MTKFTFFEKVALHMAMVGWVVGMIGCIALGRDWERPCCLVVVIMIVMGGMAVYFLLVASGIVMEDENDGGDVENTSDDQPDQAKAEKET